MSDFRERAAERERDPKINCKRCVDYCPPSPSSNDLPVCLRWSGIQQRLYTISPGYSGERNAAPFCQYFKVKC